MKIDNRFLIFKTLQGYKDADRRGKVENDSIVFVIENRGIYTHGIQFGNDPHNRGLIGSVDKLPMGSEGDSAIVKEGDDWFLYYYNDGEWVKGDQCDIPSMTQDTLDQYIKKVNVREYVDHIHDDAYVRRDEVYTPEQEDWIRPSEDDDEWQWDENGNLYKIDAELSHTSRNSVQNRVITEALDNKKNPIVYEQYTVFLQDLEQGLIPDDVVVYIKDKSLIYAFGTYFSGGSGGGGGVPFILDTPILYIRPTNRDADISPSLNVYTQVTELTSNKALTISLSNQYLHLVVPTQYSITKIVTSNNETLSLQDDFEAETVEINGRIMNAYKYIPVIAPSISLTFTFNIPE